MKSRDILLAVAIATVLFSCSSPKVFTTNVDTSKTPWTNLHFNNDPQNFHFALISDRTGGNRPGIFEDGIRKLNMMQPEFVINIGDLLPGYTTDTAVIRKDWEEVNGIISKLTMPFFYLPGNHDITNSTMGKVWEERFGCRYYSFTYKKCLFLVLDSNDDRDFNLSRKQTDYAIKSIQNNSKVRWTFLLMHHPIWKYNTEGRFQEIEKVLKDRKYTVFAGHEHHYQQTERNGSNFIVLSTTGAGSNLRGNYFGEFDHISWVTVSDKGPIITNLRLDGILPYNISNDQTVNMARPMVENATFPHVILCNSGQQFTHGTCYFSFKNSSFSDLKVHLGFFQQNQLKVENADQTILVGAGSNKVVEVSFVADKPLNFNEITPLKYAWEMKYVNPDYPGFALQGESQIIVKPSETTIVDNEMDAFIGKTSIRFEHPYQELKTLLRINNDGEKEGVNSLEIEGNIKISLLLKNGKEEFTNEETRNFVRVNFLPSLQAVNLKPGLNYRYYEGDWQAFPDFGQLKSREEGVASNLMVQDLSRRDHNWALVYSGYMMVSEDALYGFKVSAEDGCRLLIDGQSVVNEHTQIKGEHVGAAALRKGLHKFSIEFIEKSGRPRLRIQAKKSGEPEWTALDFAQLMHN